MERFAFRRLAIYKDSMAMTIEVNRALRALPRDQQDLLWQVRRAARSVLLNVAEGAGEFSPKEKARFYRIARRSAWETVAGLDIALEERLFTPAQVKRCLDLLDRVVARLTTMIKRSGAATLPAHSTTRKVTTPAAKPPRPRSSVPGQAKPRPRPRPPTDPGQR